MPDASTTQLLVVAAASGTIGATLTAVTKRAEFRREDRARWLGERESAYAALLSATSDTAQGITGLLPPDRGDGDLLEYKPDQGKFERFRQRLDDSSAALGRVVLLAPEPLVQLGIDLSGATNAYLRAVLTEGGDQAEKEDAASAASRAFRHAARIDLGITKRVTWYIELPWR